MERLSLLFADWTLMLRLLIIRMEVFCSTFLENWLSEKKKMSYSIIYKIKDTTKKFVLHETKIKSKFFFYF
jgi:hypothetical protein